MVGTSVEPDWLEPDSGVIEGLDHLGTQVVSINLYGLLLPGITNVTDRARYLSLYPWVVHRYAQNPQLGRTKRGWREFLRAVDFTYAVCCASLELTTANGDSPVTTSGIVGITKARALLKGASLDTVINVAPYVSLDADEKVPTKGAYFKNPEGGFGQYYKGSLTVLGALAEGNVPPLDRQLTTYAGRPLAESLDRNRAFEDLLTLALTGRATVEEFARVGELVGPASIVAGSEEQRVLRCLVLGDDEDLCRGQQEVQRRWRRASLALLTRFARDAEAVEETQFVNEFRWSCAAGALPDGTPWALDESMRLAAEGWGAYHRNDTLSFVLEAVFWVALRWIAAINPTPRLLAETMARFACDEIDADGDAPGSPPLEGSVADWVRQCEHVTGAAGVWDETSTDAWVGRLRGALNDEDEGLTLRWSVRLLGRLATDRGIFRLHPFEHIPGAVAMGDVHAIHIGHWYARVEDRAVEGVREFLTALILEWVIYRHLRIATRKLANQGASTFKFRPEEGRCILSIREKDPLPEPTFTNPRLRQSQVILRDLGLLEVREGMTGISTDGAGWLGAVQ